MAILSKISLCLFICSFGMGSYSYALPSKFLPVHLLSQINDEGELIPRAPAEYVDPTTGIVFVKVQGGCFQMGSSSSERGHQDDEGPRTKVCLDDFWMGKYEITNSQYRLFDEQHDSQSFAGFMLDTEDQPAVYIDWMNAVAYASWLSRGTGRQYQLPTEAQWEYAARGKSSEAHAWGKGRNKICEFANSADQSAKYSEIGLEHSGCSDEFPVSSPVGSFKPNRYGLYDMLGNVWEWTSDWYADNYHHTRGGSNPTGPDSGTCKVLRGGSWFSGPEYTRVARRSWFRPDSKNNSLGFRLIMLKPDWTL